MTRWQYLSLHYVWTADAAAERPEKWTFDVTKRWTEDYASELDEANESGNGGPLWEKLGEDGWELVLHVDNRRNQYVETFSAVSGETSVQIYGQGVLGTYTFKRPIES